MKWNTAALRMALHSCTGSRVQCGSSRSRDLSAKPIGARSTNLEDVDSHSADRKYRAYRAVRGAVLRRSEDAAPPGKRRNLTTHGTSSGVRQVSRRYRMSNS
jgi:hypothetical protein